MSKETNLGYSGAIAKTIKYEGDNSTFIWKHPVEDFNKTSELIVHESQEAILFANGQAVDTFGPGRYKLDSENLPLLTKTLNLVTGTSIFHCEVYFINKTVQMALRWGTDSKVRFIEPTLGIPVEIGASGEMNLAVSDGKKLLLKLVGTMNGTAWKNRMTSSEASTERGFDEAQARKDNHESFTQSLMYSFRSLINTEVKSNLASTIKQAGIDIVEIDEHLMTLSKELQKKLVPGFEEYGLTIPQFYVVNVVLPEQDPNFRKLRELHTISLQKKMAEAQAEVKTAQAESRAAYMTAEAEAEAKIKEAQRAAVLEWQTTQTEVAKREAEREVIRAQGEAQAQAELTRQPGLAEAEVMKAKGYNEKDVLQAEVQKAYAEGIGNMGSGGSGGSGGGSVMGEMLQFGVGMAAMGAMAPQVGEMMKGIGNTGASTDASAPAASGVTCPNCGNALPANAKFCLECGTKIETLADNEIICPSCGKKTVKGKFCLECGTSLIRKCPKCEAEVPQGGKFCLECGTKLDD